MRNFFLLAGMLALGLILGACGTKGGVVILKTDEYAWTAASLVPVKEYNENLDKIRREESYAVTLMFENKPFSGKYYSVFRGAEKVWELDEDTDYILNARSNSTKRFTKMIVYQKIGVSGGSTETIELYESIKTDE